MDWSWRVLDWFGSLTASTAVVFGVHIVVLVAALYVMVGMIRDIRQK